MEDAELHSHEPSRQMVVRGADSGAPRVQYVETVEVDPQEGSESHELLEYWQILRRRKGAFLFIAFLGALGGLFVTLPQTPIYQARASLEILAPNSNILNFRDAAASDSFYEYQDAYLQTQVKILQSESLRARVAEKLRIEKRAEPEPAPGRISAWRKALRLSKPAAPAEAPVSTLPPVSVQIRIFPNTRIVEIICDSPDPAFAARYANALAHEFIEQDLEFRSSGTERNKDWLARELEDLKIKLEKSEEQLQEYGKASGLMVMSEKGNVDEDKLKQLQDQLSQARADRVSKQSQYETFSSSSLDAMPEVVDGGSIKDYQGKLVELRRELIQLHSIYTPAHPKVRRVQAQIADVEATLNKERSIVLARMRSELEAARRRESLLAAAYARQSALVTEAANKGIGYNILKREVDTNRELYKSMLEKVKETGIVSAMRTSNSRIVDAARPPGGPYKPNMTLNIAMGLLSGLFLGMVFVFLLEHADLSFKAPGDAAFYLKVPELGVIPLSTAPSTRSSYGSKVISNSPVALKGNGAGAEGDGASRLGESDPVELVTWHHKLSLVAESYRAALTSILLSGHNGNRPRIIVFTSAGPTEGKTTTVANLGIALAEINRRVLVIDADMRKPRLHSIFNLPNTWGLSDLLREKGPVETAPREALARETMIPSLYVLTSGPATVSISNLLYSRRTAELLRRFRSEFDTVLIDTPPMMQLADARILGRLADAVILVVGAGRTTRDAAKAAKQRLVDDGIPVLGAILNRWDPNSASSYGVYGYYDGYYTRKSG